MSMLLQRWLLALPLAFAFAVGSAEASSIRDRAGLFDPGTVREAEAKLEQIERETGASTTIETIESLGGRSLEEAARKEAQKTGKEGIFVLIPKKEHKVVALASRPYARALHRDRIHAIEQAFVPQFAKGDFNAGLRDGVATIGRELAEAKSEAGGRLGQLEPPIRAPIQRRAMPRPAGSAFGLGSLLGIGLLIVAVLIGIRLIGSLFGGGQGAYGPGVGRPGMGPGYGGGPGYGPGYGGRGGGFFSSLLGGIGGAMAGNWLYDQFSGRHHGGNYADNTGYTPGADPEPTAAGGDDWSGGTTGGGSDWGGGDGGDAGGGGDWGGGGDGGGGDWGGGGGGGDWGGGGGGDWGGGGGDGGSW
jgi:uncharacterized protein